MKMMKIQSKLIYIVMVCGLLTLIACSQQNEKENDLTAEAPQKSDLSISFNEPDVTYVNETLHVNGEVKTTEDVFYYTLLKNDTILIEETEVDIGDKGNQEWRQFEIKKTLKNISNEDGELPILKMYVKDKGKIVNPSFIPIDLVPY